MPTKSPLIEVYIDGASRGNPGPASLGAVFRDGAGATLAELSKYVGETTNNVAEYLALVYALQEAHVRGWTRLSVKADSELLVKQVRGEYKVRDATLRVLHDLALNSIRSLKQFSISHVPREQNAHADRLAGRAVAAHLRAAHQAASTL